MRCTSPKHFQVDDRALLFDLMRRFSFATLVTTRSGRVTASHLPFLVYPDETEYGTLVSHMAKPNEQWHDFGEGNEALVIFQGYHTYVSPSWYQAAPSVPTWNYMVAHAYGVPRVIEDEGRVRNLLRALVATYEQEFDEPWPMNLPDDYLRKMIQGSQQTWLPPLDRPPALVV